MHITGLRGLSLVPGILAGFILSGFSFARDIPEVTIAQDIPAVVYEWTKQKCEEWDVPDAPLRAFRRADGSVVAFASNQENRPFIGTSLQEIVHGCHSSLPSKVDPDPSLYQGLRFITAVWTADGIHVQALIHNEYHAEKFGTCTFKQEMKCWYTTILSARSKDSGMTFVLSNPPKVVAAIPFQQDIEQGRHRGFFNPSNILFRDGAWYMATNTTGGAGQQPGTCLFRSKDINDPAGWKGFDGHDFTAPSVDPYRDDPAHYVPCQPMTGIATLGSISYYPPADLYLAVFQGPDRDHPNGSIGYAWSKDMLHWGPRTTLLDEPGMTSKNCTDVYRYGYPSVLDGKAKGRNFDQIGDKPFVYLTRFHVEKCLLGPDRDLVRFQLEVRL
jgi:hypothetical protein